MNKLLILALLMFTAADGWAYSSARIRIMARNETLEPEKIAESRSVMMGFENEIAICLQKEFPCARVITDSELSELLDHERQLQLLGKGPEDLQAILNATIDCEYIVVLRLSWLGGSYVLDYRVLNPRSSAALIMDTRTAAPGEALAVAAKMARGLAEAMRDYEPCAYKGRVTITFNSEQKDQRTQERAVYCNHADGVYRKAVSTGKIVKTTWQLLREGNPETSGAVDGEVFEETKEEEEDGCHTCASGRQGGWTRTQIDTYQGRVTGLSDESLRKIREKGWRHDNLAKDAVINLKFNPDGTFNIKVRAASDPQNSRGTWTQKEQAEGTCDVFTHNNHSEYRPAIGLPDLKWGSFSGRSSDKTLRGKREIRLFDPAINEETTAWIDFELSRQ